MLELIGTFFSLAAVVAAAGTVLAMSADRIAEATGLGRMLVGSILLAAVTSLPELTVNIAAVREGHPDLAVGDLFGACLMNLLTLAAIDLLHRSGGGMLSRTAASHALSGTFSIGMLSLACLGVLTASRLPRLSIFGVGAWVAAMPLAYALGARMMFIDQRISARAAKEPGEGRSVRTTWKDVSFPAMAFIGAATVIVLVGPILARAAAKMAERTGLGGTFVGTTFVAACTTLPEIVVSLTAMRIRAFDMVIGNIFGSNAFNMVLLWPLDIAHDGRLLADVSLSHAVTALAAILATAIAVLGQLYHVERRMRVIEPDAMLMLLVVFGALWLVFRLS